jgi:AcrR family transcriptional regulator
MSLRENQVKNHDHGGAIRAQNSRKILAAAEIEFAKHGFKGTSIQAIADRVQLPKANILYYFKSKTGLYQALLKEILDMWNQGFSEHAAEHPPCEVLSRYIVEKMRYSRSHPQRSKIFAMEIIQGAPIIKEAIQLPMVGWANSKANVIQQWADKGLIPAVEPLYILFLIWGATQFYADFDTEIGLIKNGPLSDEEYRQAEMFIVNTILTGLGLSSAGK